MDKPPKTIIRWGAAPEDWVSLDKIGIGSDLLPVVSRPDAQISPRSTLTSVGKTPSRYDNNGLVVGIPQWSLHQASDADLRRWAKEPDYGICVQTRNAPFIDVDVPDEAVARAIEEAVQRHLGEHYDIKLPVRRRSNSGKRGLWFRLPGAFAKRIMHVEGGIIELLGAGQQFIACGTHQTGVRYHWDCPVEDLDPPYLTVQQVDDIWHLLTELFAIEPPRETRTTERRRGEDLDVEDPIADWLEIQGLALGEDARGAILIECPWEHEHSSGEAGDTSTVWFRAGTNGHSAGHFKCLHAHCAGRTRREYLEAVGYEDPVADDFEDLGPDPEDVDKDETLGEGDGQSSGAFNLIQAADFAAQPSGSWLVKGLIPKEELVVVYGASGAGKSFVMIDLCMAIARGVAWRNCRVKQGKVIYIAAEGGGGVRKRLKAYAHHHQVDLASLPFYVLHASPNLLDKGQVKKLIAAIEAAGDVALVVCDTFAQMTPGANENAAEDMGLAIAHVRAVGRKSGATTVLVHHAGKDAAKGARGWSGIKAAADAEVEVTRDGDARSVNTTKQKDADDGASWPFKLEIVPIGMDDDGDVIESCVVVESDLHVAAGVKDGGGAAKSRKQLGDWERALLDVYAELAVGGDVLKSELIIRAADTRPEAGTVKVRRGNVRAALRNLRKGNESPFLPPEPGAKAEEDTYVVARS